MTAKVGGLHGGVICIEVVSFKNSQLTKEWALILTSRKGTGEKGCSRPGTIILVYRRFLMGVRLRHTRNTLWQQRHRSSAYTAT